VFRRSRDEKLTWIEAHTRLYGLTRADAEALARTGDRIGAPAGTVLASAGHAGREAFLVISGEVEIRQMGEVIARSGPGELVGELSLVLGEVRNADAVATTDVELVAFDPRAFWLAMDRSPALRAHVEQTVEARSAA
jgi:CRP/FNR family transcriptional regulator, cyclic AMP receptor protein